MKAFLDVEAECSYNARYHHARLPAGVPRIFSQSAGKNLDGTPNYGWWFCNSVAKWEGNIPPENRTLRALECLRPSGLLQAA